MKKKENLSEKERLDDIEKRLESSVSTYQAATLFDYKLNEFIRLGEFKTLQNPSILSPMASCPLPGMYSAVITYLNFISEMDKIKAKIENIPNVIPPPMPPPGEPIPPVVFNFGIQKLRQALEVIKAAKEAAENTEPESARDSLKEAKDLLKHESVRNEFRRIRQVKTWYDILEELQNVIDYFEKICK